MTFPENKKSPREAPGFRWWSLFALLVPAFGGTARADEPSDPLAGPPPRPAVLVPFETGSRPGQESEASRYFIDYETFQVLWARAKAWREQEGPNGEKGTKEGGPADAILTQALYQAWLRTDHLEVEARLDLLVRGGEWMKVPLPFEGVELSGILLNDQPAAYQDGHLVVERAGRHAVSLRFRVPFPAGAPLARWGMPAASAALLAVTVEDAALDLVLGPGEPLPLVESADTSSPGARVFTAALGGRQQVEIKRQARTTGRAMAQPNVASVEARLYVTPAVERLETTWLLEFPGQEGDRFAVTFDKSVTPLAFEIPNLASWRLVEGSGAMDGLRQLEFELTRPVRDALRVGFVGERIVAGGGPVAGSGQRRFPRLGAAASRVEQRRTLLRAEELNVKVEPGSLHRQAELLAGDRGIPGFQPVASFSVSGMEDPLGYDVGSRVPRREVTTDYVYQVGAGKLETICQLQLRSPDAALHGTMIRLPAGASLQTVTGNRLQDWWRTGDELFVRFSGDTPEVTALLVHLTKEVGAQEAETGLPALGLPEFPVEQVRGGALVVGHVTQESRLTLGGNGRGLREVGAGEVGADFEVLAPLQRKRAFRFERGDFQASVALSPVAPKYDTRWVMLAQAHDSWIRLSVHVDVEVSLSALDRVVFHTAESVPEVRVTGGEVREVRSEVESGRRRYTVLFQRHVSDAVEFTVETEIPHGGAASLSDFAFPEAARTERYVILENQGTDKMGRETRGLESTVVSLLPYRPATLGSAEIWRAQEGWGLDMRIEKLSTSAGNEAVILLGDITTALRPDGEVWHRAVYHLRNRSLQFLPVILPGKAELVSVTVAGNPVRADQGEVGGQAALLIPLIQTKPGQLAYDIALAYRSRDAVRADGKTLKSHDLRLADPRLPGLTVERTLWHLYLPDGYEITDWDGNLRKSDERDVVLERIRSELSELQNLSWVGGAAVYDNSLRGMAIDNGLLVCSQIDQKLTQLRQGAGVPGGEIVELEKKLGEQRALFESHRSQALRDGQASPQTAQPYFGAVPAEGVKEARGGTDWAVNNTVIEGRNRKLADTEERQLDRVESQMRLNDNLSLGNAFFYKDQGSGQAGAEEKPKEAGKAEAGQKAQIGKLDEQQGANRAVDSKLNTLNHAQEEALARKQDKSSRVAKDESKSDARAGDLGADGAFKGKVDASSASASTEGQVVEPQKRKSDVSRLYNLARSRVVSKSEAAVRSGGGESPPPPPAPPAPAAQPASGGAPGAAGREAGQVDALTRQSDFVVTTGGVPVVGQSPVLGRVFQPVELKLEVQGRRSVEVAFPVEGEAHHFFKLKDHAELQVQARELPRRSSLPWLFLLVGWVVAIWLADRVLRRWRSRRGQFMTPRPASA